MLKTLLVDFYLLHQFPALPISPILHQGIGCIPITEIQRTKCYKIKRIQQYCISDNCIFSNICNFVNHCIKLHFGEQKEGNVLFCSPLCYYLCYAFKNTKIMATIMKTYKPMQTPQAYFRQLNTTNIGLENIDNEIRGLVGDGDIVQIDFKENKIPPFVPKKAFEYVAKPDFLCSILLGSVHSLALDFTIYQKELSYLINNEMQKSAPDFFVIEMLEGMRKYRQLYKAKEKQCILLQELIAYYQTGNNPYWTLGDGKSLPRWEGVTGYFRSLDNNCKTFLKIADYYKNDNKQTACPTKQTKQPLVQKADFRKIIQYEDKKRLIERLHKLIDGKSGADVGAVLLNAQQKKYITRNPTKKEFESEFELIGSWSAIKKYLNPNTPTAGSNAEAIVIF